MGPQSSSFFVVGVILLFHVQIIRLSEFNGTSTIYSWLAKFMQIVGIIQWRLLHFWWPWKYATEIELQFSGAIMRAVKLLKCKNISFSFYVVHTAHCNFWMYICMMFKQKFWYISCLKLENRSSVCSHNSLDLPNTTSLIS